MKFTLENAGNTYEVDLPDTAHPPVRLLKNGVDVGGGWLHFSVMRGVPQAGIVSTVAWCADEKVNEKIYHYFELKIADFLSSPS